MAVECSVLSQKVRLHKCIAVDSRMMVPSASYSSPIFVMKSDMYNTGTEDLLLRIHGCEEKSQLIFGHRKWRDRLQDVESLIVAGISG